MSRWVRPNIRVLLLGMLLPGFVCALILAMLLGPATEWHIATRVALAVVGALALSAVLTLARDATRPRIAYRSGYLLVYLGSGRPYEIPIGVVEAFLLGQGPSQLPGPKHERTETRTLIIKLADSATDWEHREIKSSLGRWCGSYVTILGTWCEPLDVNLVRRLNERLAEVSHATQAG